MRPLVRCESRMGGVKVRGGRRGDGVKVALSPSALYPARGGGHDVPPARYDMDGASPIGSTASLQPTAPPPPVAIRKT